MTLFTDDILVDTYRKRKIKSGSPTSVKAILIEKISGNGLFGK